MIHHNGIKTDHPHYPIIHSKLPPDPITTMTLSLSFSAKSSLNFFPFFIRWIFDASLLNLSQRRSLTSLALVCLEYVILATSASFSNPKHKKISCTVSVTSFDFSFGRLFLQSFGSTIKASGWTLCF